MQLFREYTAGSRTRTGLAISHTRPVVGTDLDECRDFGLDSLPSHIRVSEPGVQDHNGIAAPSTVEVHFASVHIYHTARRRVSSPLTSQRQALIQYAAGDRGRHQDQQQANRTPQVMPGAAEHTTVGWLRTHTFVLRPSIVVLLTVVLAASGAAAAVATVRGLAILKRPFRKQAAYTARPIGIPCFCRSGADKANSPSLTL